MKFYTSTHKIPQLRDMSLQQRLDAVSAAAQKLTGPEKLLLNVLKLLVIVPVFVFILQSADNLVALIWAVLVLMLYPLLIKPVQISLSAKYLASANRK